MSRNQSHMQSQALSHRTRRLDERVEKLILTWVKTSQRLSIYLDLLLSISNRVLLLVLLLLLSMATNQVEQL